VDPARFHEAVAGAADVLHAIDGTYDPAIYLTYTRRIVELMGGTGPALDAAAREIYDDWSEHHHFSLYEDVPEALGLLHAHGIRIGLISNTQRCLTSFQAHFDLGHWIEVAISSSTHGFMKPHPSIFRAALERMDVDADHAVMVGDSLQHDVLGARGVGMHGVLLARDGAPGDLDRSIPVIKSLVELPGVLQSDVLLAARAV
jgi:HAD superfamily hydrolase (TIGR01662 family)